MESIRELCRILILIFIFYLTSTAITAQGLNHKHDANPNLIKMLDTISPSQPRNVTFHLPPDPQISPTKVPALFVIGDSSVDCGTNNFLGTFARADRLPYGKDFDTHQPTGRFCNGRIPVDYIGNFLFIFSWFLTWVFRWPNGVREDGNKDYGVLRFFIFLELSQADLIWLLLFQLISFFDLEEDEKPSMFLGLFLLHGWLSFISGSFILFDFDG